MKKAFLNVLNIRENQQRWTRFLLTIAELVWLTRPRKINDGMKWFELKYEVDLSYQERPAAGKKPSRLVCCRTCRLGWLHRWERARVGCNPLHYPAYTRCQWSPSHPLEHTLAARPATLHSTYYNTETRSYRKLTKDTNKYSALKAIPDCSSKDYPRLNKSEKSLNRTSV